jgi:hypothetical protein
MERLWLIRTRHNKILGPVALKKIAELLGKGSLGPYDEIASGNGYWIRVRESELIQRYIQRGEEQVFNPLNAAKPHPNLLAFIDDVMAGKRPLRENTLTNVRTNTDISMVGKNIPKTDPAIANQSVTPTSASGQGTMPGADDLAYPSMDDIAQIDASVDAAPVAAADPGKAATHSPNPVAQADAGGAKLPSADDLDFPDMDEAGAPSSAAPAAASTITASDELNFEIDENAAAASSQDSANEDHEADDEAEDDASSFSVMPTSAGKVSKSKDSQTGILTRAHFDLKKLQREQAAEDQAEIEASAAAAAEESGVRRPAFTSLPNMEDEDEEEAAAANYGKSSLIRVKSLEKKQRRQNFRNWLIVVTIIAAFVGALLGIGRFTQLMGKKMNTFKQKAAASKAAKSNNESTAETPASDAAEVAATVTATVEAAAETPAAEESPAPAAEEPGPPAAEAAAS